MNRWTIAAWILILAGVAVGVAIVITALSMYDASYRSGAQAGAVVSGGEAAASAGAASPGSLPPGSRLVIPSVDVDAGIIAVGVDASGVMGTPSNGWDVGWYDFSAAPGQPGNSVMTGHVDYYDVGAAVFWRLRDLGPGDEVQVHLPEGDGAVTYQVTEVESYDAGTAPVDAIIGPTDDDVLTLITCDGWFDPSVREYDHRLVVRAERVS
jgi:LPXTG-site transpeptidase (sortase) family protein